MWAIVGTRTTQERNARGEGISVYRVNMHTGSLERVQLLRDLVNPSFLALNAAGDRLYVVHGDGEEISAFGVERGTGQLNFLNRQSTQGRNPVHLALDASGRHVVVSNHLSSALVVLPVEDDGRLGPVCQTVAMAGEPGPHRKEQPFAKPHFNPLDPSGRYVVVPDKGLDQTWVFRFEAGRLSDSPCAILQGREASGPRHIAFHPHKPWAYVVNELDSTVTACRFDALTGALEAFQIRSALADDFVANSRASEIEVHPGGRTLYSSNRGEDSIAVWSIDPSSGRIELIQTQPSGGRTPRFFELMPGGRFLLVLNEDSDTIDTFAVDPASGRLSPTGQPILCGSPVCVVFSAAGPVA